MAQPWYTGGIDYAGRGIDDLLGTFGQYGEQDKKEANRQALMALGFGLMGGRKGQELATLGRAGLGALDQRSLAMANAQAQRQGQFQNALAMLKFQQAQQQAAAQEAQAQEMAGAFAGGPQLQNMGPGGPTPANAQATAGPSLIEQYRKASVVAAKSGNSEAAKRFADIANGMEAEFSTTPQTLKEPGGDLASVLIGKRGETKKLPYLPAEKLHFATTGAMAGVGLNPFTGKPESSGLPVTMDPAQMDVSKRGWAQLAQTERHFKEGKAGGGKPQWDSTTGQFVFAPTGPGDTGRAVTPAGYKPAVKAAPEAYSTQVAGIENLSSAMTDYKKKLKTWSNYDLTNPDARAEMSTAYTDMLMQAKEAYRLGVLNGPDYQLLTATITDPVSARGALVSNKAMEKQIEQMQDKMEARKANLAKVYKQPQGNTGGATGGWSAVEIK